MHKYIDPNWLFWFIGFSEGDGGIHVYNNSFIFGLTQREEGILLEIKSVLGFGKVYFDSSSNAYRYRVTRKNDIFKLAVLFNGKLVTKNKINQLEQWINIINEASSEKLIFNSSGYLPTLSDAWLSGFATAEGSFNVSVINQKVKKEVISDGEYVDIKEVIQEKARIRFVIDQKEESVLLHIKHIFGVGSVNRTGDPGVFRYTNGSLKSNSLTVDYFNLFPAKGLKQDAFLKWCDIRTMLLEKKHLKEGGMELIKEMAKNVNKK